MSAAPVVAALLAAVLTVGLVSSRAVVGDAVTAAWTRLTIAVAVLLVVAAGTVGAVASF